MPSPRNHRAALSGMLAVDRIIQTATTVQGSRTKTSHSLSAAGKEGLRKAAAHQGITQSAVMEIMIREFNEKRGIE